MSFRQKLVWKILFSSEWCIAKKVSSKNETKKNKKTTLKRHLLKLSPVHLYTEIHRMTAGDIK